MDQVKRQQLLIGDLLNKIKVASYLSIGVFVVLWLISCSGNEGTPQSPIEKDNLICYDSLVNSVLKDHITTCFDSTSNLKEYSVSYRGLAKHGKAIKYFKDESVELIENYQLGVLEGWSKQYNVKGELFKEIYFRKGKIVYIKDENGIKCQPYLKYPINTIKDSSYIFEVYFLPKPIRGTLLLEFGMNECDAKVLKVHRVDLDEKGNALQPFVVDVLGQSCITSRIFDSLNVEVEYLNKHETISINEN